MNNPATLSPRRRRLFLLVLIVGTLSIAEVLARVALSTKRLATFEEMRLRLADHPEAASQGCIGQPYLLYAPAPYPRDQVSRGHNTHGYRGPQLAMDRDGSIRRVLCLGGSTTYGWSVDDPTLTYPAQLQAILNQDHPGSVEVINAGVPWATSAELMTHYHFKWHYYQPDLVIIHTGGNDAEAMALEHYQPDYSHWRHQPCVAPALPRQTRPLMSSRLVALTYIAAFHWNPGQPFTRFSDFTSEVPAIPWYPRSGAEDPEHRLIPRAEDAFRHNLDELISAITRDGAKVLLVPFRARTVNDYSKAVMTATHRNEATLIELATAHQVPVAPFPADAVLESDWSDKFCHLTAAGERKKAERVAPFARVILDQTGINGTGKTPG